MAHLVETQEDAPRCDWLLSDGYDDCGTILTIECGARSFETPTGWNCDNGHEFVRPAVRFAQGWDYAEDEGEAAQLAHHGTTPVLRPAVPMQL